MANGGDWKFTPSHAVYRDPGRAPTPPPMGAGEVPFLHPWERPSSFPDSAAASASGGGGGGFLGPLFLIVLAALAFDKVGRAALEERDRRRAERYQQEHT